MKTIILFLLLFPVVALASFSSYTIEISPDSQFIENSSKIAPRGNLGLKTIVLDMIKDAGFDPIKADKIIQCESGWNPEAIGDSTIGGSYGLWQIYQPVHPIGEDAFDPIKSTEYAIKLMEKSGFRPWSCARILGLL